MKSAIYGITTGVALSIAAPLWSQATADREPVVFRVDVVSRTTKAINYHHRQGSTTVGLEASSLVPKAKGEAKVDSKTGATKVEATVEKLPAASTLGEGYLTYVLWAITPEGRAENLGELMLDDGRARLQAGTELQSFGMIVTAEPYYAVTQPSDFVVMEGVVKRGSTTGTIMPIEAKYELVSRGGYLQQLPPGDRVRLREAKNIPLDLMEARQAMAVAKAAGGMRYAGDTLQKAEVDLRNAEMMLEARKDTKKIQSLSRHVTQLAEDARLIAVRKTREDALAAERAEAERRANELRENAQMEEKRRREAEAAAAQRAQEAALAQKQALEAQQRSVEVQRQADAARELARLEREKQEALAAERARTAAAEAEAERAKQLALQAEIARAKEAAEAQRLKQVELEQQVTTARESAARAEAERVKMRTELARQLNMVLATRESARGLIVNMSDVLFDTARYTLKPLAREKLARIAGIIQTSPGLKIEVEGHTDSTGSEAFNQKLSEQRADAVRSYLVSQGIEAGSVTARGFGQAQPAADNSSAAGRQANRRVELVVNGAAVTPDSAVVSQ